MTHHSMCTHAWHQECARSFRFSSCLVVLEPRIWNWLLLCWSKWTILQHSCHSDQSSSVHRYVGAGCTRFLLGCEQSPDLSSSQNSSSQRSAMRRMSNLWSNSNRQSNPILVCKRLQSVKIVWKSVTRFKFLGLHFVSCLDCFKRPFLLLKHCSKVN